MQGAQPNWDPGANSSAEAGHPFDIGIATEGVDRWNLSLTAGQEEVLQAAAGASRGPVVVSLIGGASIARVKAQLERQGDTECTQR